MKTTIILLFFLFIENSIFSLPQSAQFDTGYNFYNKKKYVNAVRFFYDVSKSCSNDTELQSEAEYFIFKSAQEILIEMSNEYAKYLYNHNAELNGPDEIRNKTFKNAEKLVENKKKILSKLGFKIIGPQHYFLQIYAMADWKILEKIIKRNPASIWAEECDYILVDIERTLNCNDIPYIVVKNAKRFLKKYPNSKYKIDIYLKLALAYNDLIGCEVHSCKVDTNSKDRKKCPESSKFRKKALYYFNFVLKNKNKLIYKKFDKYYSAAYEEIKKDWESHYKFYYSD